MQFMVDECRVSCKKCYFFACRNRKRLYICNRFSFYKQITFSSSALINTKRSQSASLRVIMDMFSNYFFMASSTETATATVAPTIGLLPIPRNPIISTCAGTDDEPAN